MGRQVQILDLKKMPPMEIITRNLLLADLVTLPPNLLKEVAPELIQQMELQVQADDGSISVKEIEVVNWFKAVFQTNTPHLEFIINHFQRKNSIITEKNLEEMKEQAEKNIKNLLGVKEEKTEEKTEEKKTARKPRKKK